MIHSSGGLTGYLLDGKDPDRIALLFVGQEYSYGALVAGVDRMARLVLAMGGRKGDRAVLIADNSFFWVTSYLGILRAGLVCVPLSAQASERELDEVLRISEPRIVFAQGNIPGFAAIRPHNLPVITDNEVLDAPAAASDQPLPDIDPDDLAALMFTSGSTGQPRGVMLSHRNIVANTDSIIEYLQLTCSDRIMAILPFYYCFGTSLLHTHLRVGGSVVVDSRFRYTETVLQRMIDTACTGFAGVPSHFQILLRASGLRKKKFPSLRTVQQAGGHLKSSFLQELSAVLPAAQIFVMYGQTEATARLSYLPPEHFSTKLGSIGRGIPGVALRVVNDAGCDVEPGEVGEIVARGENVARGYWRSPEESEACFRDGALYTGDLATVDSDGFIYIVDRAKDFLKCRGQRVSCRQIEDQLLACDELLEAAVIGIPDEILGEAVKAFVVPRTPDYKDFAARLTLFCKTHMPVQYVPKEVVVLASLPKNSAGKVLKTQLRAS